MTKRRRSALPPGWIAFCIISTLFSFASAQQAATSNYAAKIDHLTSEVLQKERIPAITVAVAVDGHVTYSRGVGTADIEHAVVANNDTLIRTGSLAKPITAVAAMTLVESGKLDLDAPVQRYCPAFPQKRWTITTRELLTHTSGIRHYKENEIENTKHYKNMSDGFTIFADDPLLFEPGTKFSYSTYGYTVVGCVIEGSSGEKFFDYVQKHVLVPSNMTHTFVDDVYSILPNRARGYQVHDGRVENAGPMDSSYKIPGGGLVSTAEDFVRFGSALMDGKIVRSDTLRLLWSPTGTPTLDGGKPSTYALGFGVLTLDGQEFVTHSGGQQGTSTDFAFLPARHFAVAVFANDENAHPERLVNSILDLYRMPHTRD